MNAHELLRVQHYESAGSDGQVRLTAERPYVRLARGAQAVFIKGGGVFGEGGHVVQPLPDWFWEEARKVSPEVRARVGLHLPDEPTSNLEAGQVTQSVTPEVTNTWTCPTCDETMPMKKRSFHRINHQKAARKVAVAGAV